MAFLDLSEGHAFREKLWIKHNCNPSEVVFSVTEEGLAAHEVLALGLQSCVKVPFLYKCHIRFLLANKAADAVPPLIASSSVAV